MLISYARLANIPILSLHLGGRVGVAKQAIINPGNLRVVAYEVETSARGNALLLTESIREVGSLGVIIDDDSEFIQPGDVIRLDEIRTTNFQLIGLSVLDEDKKKVGRVNGYTLETDLFEIRQISVNPGLIKRLSTTEMLVNRSQIIEVNDRYIIIKSPKVQQDAPVVSQERGAFVNPFRQPQSPQPESSSAISS